MADNIFTRTSIGVGAYEDIEIDPPLQVPAMPENNIFSRLPRNVDPSAALRQVESINPDQAADQQRLAQSTGMPEEAVAADPEFVKNAFEETETNRLLRDAPIVSGFMAMRPNAAVARDDVSTLTALEQVWQPRQTGFSAMRPEGVPGGAQAWLAPGGGLDRAEAGSASVAAVYQQAAAAIPLTIGMSLRGLGEAWRSGNRLLNDINFIGMDPAVRTEIENINAGIPWWLKPDEILIRPGQLAVDLSEAIGPSDENKSLSSEIAGGVGQVATQITAAVLTGGASSFTSVAALLGQGFDIQAQMVEEADAEGSTAGDIATLLGGPTTAILERFGIGALLDKIPAKVKSKIFQVLSGMTTEAVQEVSEAVLQNLTAFSLYNPDIEIFDGLEEQATVAGATGAIVSLIIPGRAGLQYKEMLDRAKELGDISKLAERMPERFGELFGTLLRERETPDLSIDVTIVDEALGSEGSAFFFTYLGLSEEAAEARTRGGEVVIPPEVFGEKVLLSDNYAKLADHIRVGGFNMTAAEAKAASESGINDLFLQMGDNFPADTAPAEQAVTLAQAELGLKAMFSTAEEAGMTDQEYANYLLTVQTAADVTVNRQKDALLRQEQRKLTAEWRAEEEIISGSVVEHIRQEPVYAALEALTSGTLALSRLNRKAVLALLQNSPETLAKLPKGPNNRAIYAEGGIDPEIVAQQFGFDSADIMLFTMLDSPPIAEIAAQETDRQMKERHGDLANQRQAVATAREALHNDTQADVLVLELNALRASQKQKRISPKLLRQYAKQRIAKLSVGDIDTRRAVSRFMNEARRNGLAAGKALRKGDRAEATLLKFQQLVNFEMAKQAMSARDTVARQYKYFRKFLHKKNTLPGVKIEYVEMVRDLLGNIGLTVRTPVSSPNFINKAQDRDGAILPASTIVPFIDNKRPWRTMPLENWNALHTSIKAIEAQGRRVLKIQRGGEQLEFDTAKQDLLNAADQLPTLGRSIRKATFSNSAIPRRDRIVSKLIGLHAAIVKTEEMLRDLDNGKNLGPWHQTLFQGFVDAKAAEHKIIQEYFQPLLEQLENLSIAPEHRLSRKIHVPELGRTFTYGDLMMMAWNVGTQSNYDKMIEGSGKEAGSSAWTVAGVEAALDHLTAEQWAWVQKAWDTWAALYPQVEAIYRTERNDNPVKIAPRSFTTKHGQLMKGGYAPVMYDTSRMTISPEGSKARMAEPTNALKLMQTDETQASVFNGLVKERTGFSAPILLDLDALPRAINRVAHYLTHYVPVRDSLKMLNDSDIKTTINSKLGPEFYEELKVWLETVASDGANKTNESAAWRATFGYIRSNVTAAILGASWTTAASQTFGFTQSVSVLGERERGGFSNKDGVRWMISGLDQYIANPTETARWAFKLSQELPSRLKSTNREISDSMDFLKGRSGVWSKQQQASLMAIGGAQLYIVDLPTWVAGFNKGIAEGMVEADAARYADSVLRRSQGTGHIKDLNRLQRSQGVWRILTMFMTYTSTLYNQQRQAVRGAKKLRNIPGSLSKMAWLVAATAMLDILLRQDWPEEEDEVGEFLTSRLTSQAFMSIPFFGPAYSSIVRGFTPDISPVESLGRYAAKVSSDLYEAMFKDGELDEKTYLNAFSLVGTATGFGFTAPTRRAWEALSSDETTDWYDYLIGPPKE